MPQLDIFSYSSQIFWFIIIFWGLYIVLYSTFVFPFAFILKVRTYLSILTPKTVLSGLTTTSKFSFDESNINNTNQIFNTLGSVQNLLSLEHDFTLNSTNKFIDNSFDSFHKDTDFLAFCLYISLKSK